MLKKLESMFDWCDDHSIFISGSIAAIELLWLLEIKLKGLDN